ncbi:MAG: oligoendopeptidase F [Casimicrobiaceae bacterium]
MRTTFAIAVLLVSISSAFADTEADRWNLADLYSTTAAWNADAAKLTSQFTEMAACKGHLGDSAARFRQCLELRYDMQKRYYRMAVYSGEQLDADTSLAPSLELDQRSDVLGNGLTQAVSFFDPEVLALGKPRVEAMLAADPGLAIYRFPLARILRAAPHTLDAEGEALIASFGNMDDAGRSTYEILTNADMPWPTVKLADGTDAKLDPTGYEKYRESPDRGERKRVMDAFFGQYKAFEHTFGVTLYSQLKQTAVHAKVRKYPDSLTAALDRNAIPVAVFDTLIAQTNANLPTLHRYFRLRAKMLGISDMHYYDIYPPLVHGDFKFPYAQGRQLVLDAVAPLGKEYVDTLRRGLDSRWMDTYPRPHKQGGAHMAGVAYDVHPYVLMNYHDNYESVSTIAHEWGHAMHSYLANRAQPFATAQYATFIAEIASTFNENLLLDHMLKQAKTDDEKLFYLGTALENLRGGFFRQAMFAEFERNVHARVDRGEALTGEEMTKTYCDILKRYHGVDAGVMQIDPVDCVEWAFIPHFYNAFYVYQYSTSLAASSLFAQRVTASEPGALTRYLTMLKAGNSDYPYDLVKTAGVDLASPAPYQALVAQMNAIMDQMEAIVARRK